MNYIKNIILGTLCLLCISCENNFDANHLLDQKQYTVINGYLCPQDANIKIQVSKSKTIGGSEGIEDLLIANALVSIKDTNGNSINLPYSSTSYSYEISASEFPIIAGQKYFLSVEINDDTFQASCTIPSEMVQNVDVTVQNHIKPWGGEEKEIIINFPDIKNTKNYYVVASYDDIPNSNFYEYLFVLDTGFENRNITATAIQYYFDEQPEKIQVRVANAEKILYDAISAMDSNYSNEGIVFYESVVSPSNIEGKDALGVFAGYQLTIVEQDID